MRSLEEGQGQMVNSVHGAGYPARRIVAALLLALIVSMGNQGVRSVAADTPDAMTMAATATPDALPVAPIPGLPVRLRIPKINVDAGIESVGMTPDGAMDIPADFHDAAWYQLGPRPGAPGNAVMDGHVDWITSPAVFWKLRNLTAGDEIRVLGDDGIERQFIVTGWETYAAGDVPMQRIFGPTDGAHLNLITCDSQSHFNRSTAEYAGNLVVYADAAP